MKPDIAKLAKIIIDWADRECVCFTEEEAEELAKEISEKCDL